MTSNMFVSTKFSARGDDNGPFDQDISDQDVWPIVNSFFEEYGLIHHQLESYNEFIMYSIPKIVEENKFVEVNLDGQKYTIEFGEVICQGPEHKELSEEVNSIYPKQCIDRDISYMSNLVVDIEFSVVSPL